MAVEPGHPNQGVIRRNARLLGIVLTAIGAIVVIGAVVVFAQAFSSDYDPFAEEGVPTPVYGVLGVAVGGFLLVFGMGLLRAGYGGAALRYAAGEVAPTIKDTMTYLGDKETAATGPFCSTCGVRNDERARYCDACGKPIG